MGKVGMRGRMKREMQSRIGGALQFVDMSTRVYQLENRDDRSSVGSSDNGV